MDRKLQERLKKAILGRTSVDLGHLQLINLDMVKAEVGDNWGKLREKVYSVAAHFVEKRISADDVLIRCEGGFVLVFAQLTGSRAKEAVDAISSALNLFFLGDRILKHLKISTSVQAVSVEDLEQIITGAMQQQAEDTPPSGKSSARSDQPPGQAPSANWRSLPGQGREESRHSNEEDGTNTGAAAGWRSEDGARQGRAPGQWQHDEGSIKSEASAQWGDQSAARSKPVLARQSRKRSPIEGEVPDFDQLSGSDSPDKPERPSTGWTEAVNAAGEATEATDLGLPEAVFTDSGSHWDDVIFKPFWDSQTFSITAHICLARRIVQGSVYYGRDTLRGSDDRSVHRSLDRAVAIAAQRGFLQLFTEGVSCPIVIPVHYDSVSGVSDRVSFFSILQSVPQHLRKYFYLRVDSIPKGTPLSQMQELLRSMKCFGSNLLVKLDFGDNDFTPFEGCTVDLFGSETPDRLNRGDIDESDIHSLVVRSRAAKAQSAETFLTQVTDFGIINAGVSAGVRFFAGAAVADEVPLPKPVDSVGFGDLYERDQKRQAIRKTG